jgi:hypothetical protein
MARVTSNSHTLDSFNQHTYLGCYQSSQQFVCLASVVGYVLNAVLELACLPLPQAAHDDDPDRWRGWQGIGARIRHVGVLYLLFSLAVSCQLLTSLLELLSLKRILFSTLSKAMTAIIAVSFEYNWIDHAMRNKAALCKSSLRIARAASYFSGS